MSSLLSSWATVFAPSLLSLSNIWLCNFMVAVPNTMGSMDGELDGRVEGPMLSVGASDASVGCWDADGILLGTIDAEGPRDPDGLVLGGCDSDGCMDGTMDVDGAVDGNCVGLAVGELVVGAENGSFLAE